MESKPIYVRDGETDGRVRVDEEEQPVVKKAKLEDEGGEIHEGVDECFEMDDLNIERPLHCPELVHTDCFKRYYDQGVEALPPVHLPITHLREKIVDTIAKNQVTIITGSTGCGKTTQVPQFLMDSYAAQNLHCNIVVVQPRRVSVTTVAKRVCGERGWKLGTICGYKIGLTDASSKDTKLLYMTTGVFVQTILRTKDAKDFTHIIFDEVHEREQNMDFSLLCLKKFMATNSPNTKIVLMSATAEVKKFADYFKTTYNGMDIPPPVISVKTKAPYKVEIFYLDDLKNVGEIPEVSFDRPYVTKKMIKVCIKLLKQCEKFDTEGDPKAAVLIFVPGVADIVEVCTTINYVSNCPGEENFKWHSVPLHSTLGRCDQNKAFDPAPQGYRKIVVATNIAESSVTIPDISVVIDFCLAKTLINDTMINVSRLVSVWTSKANLTQRAGRVGRTRNGVVYRLIPRYFMMSEIKTYNDPDMVRNLHEKTTLHAILLGEGHPEEFLNDGLDPPPAKYVEKSLMTLTEMGALAPKGYGTGLYSPESLTLLGRLMCNMPVDIPLTRMMALGFAFGIFKQSVITAACLSVKGVFVGGYNDKIKFYLKKLTWADGSMSDSIALLHVYETWKKHRESGYFTRTGCNEQEWGEKHYVQVNMLYEADKLVKECRRRFKQEGFDEHLAWNNVMWPKNRIEHVLKLVIAGSFYPNYFSYPFQSNRCLDQDSVTEIGGRDPFRTAVFSKFPSGQNHELYMEEIQNYLAECNQHFTVTPNYQRTLFIEFPKDGELSPEFDPDIPYDPTIPGGISMGIYKTFRTKVQKKSLEIKVLNWENTQKRKRELQEKASEEKKERNCVDSTVSFPCDVPAIGEESVCVKITNLINPGKFWCRKADMKAFQLDEKLKRVLQAHKRKLEPFDGLPKFGQLCVVKNKQKGTLHRAKILYAKNDKDEDEDEDKSKKVSLTRKQRRKLRRKEMKKLRQQRPKPKIFRRKNLNQRQRLRILRRGKPKLRENRKHKQRITQIRYHWKMYDKRVRLSMKRLLLKIRAQKREKFHATVLLIDIGRKKVFKSNNIMKYSLKLYAATKLIPALAFECTLKGLRPSPFANVNSRWIPKATEFFKQITRNEILTANVYSIVKNVVCLTLFVHKHDPTNPTKLNINTRLMELGYAIECEERWISRRYEGKVGENCFEGEENYESNRYMPQDYYADDLWERTVRVVGPENILRVDFVPTSHGRLIYSVNISNSSVNNVFLNTCCVDQYSKLMVAAYVSQPYGTGTIHINETTMMPNIAGWANLITVLFAPVAEMRSSLDGTTYQGALCGLGHIDGEPIYRDHDIEVIFDVNVTEQDLAEINMIRLCTSLIFHAPFFKKGYFSNVDRVRLWKMIKQSVEVLFFQKRDPKQQELARSPYKWSNSDDSNCTKMEELFRDLGESMVFPPHPFS